MPQGITGGSIAPPPPFETARVARAGFRGAGARVPVSEGCCDLFSARLQGQHPEAVAKRHRTNQIRTAIETDIIVRRRNID